MKGFIATLVTVLFGLLLLLYVSSLRQSELAFEHQSNQFHTLRVAASLFDSVSYDVGRIIGGTLRTGTTNESVWITLDDTLPAANRSALLDAYADFLRTSLVPRLHANVSLNVSNLTDGGLERYFFERYTLLHDYENDTLAFLPGNAVLPASYALNVSVGDVRATEDLDITAAASGINLSLRYTDANGSITWDGIVSESTFNSLRITYANNRTLAIRIGGSGASRGQLAVQSNTTADIQMRIDAPALAPTEPPTYSYPALLSYVAGNASKQTVLRNSG